jgi:hypothetical protein
MRQVQRALAAAHASLQAGTFDAALRLVAAAQDRALDEFERARVDLLRAQIEFASSRTGGGPASLLGAVMRIERFDARLARASYLDALSAAMFAARFAGPGGRPQDIARAVRGSASAGSPCNAADSLLEGWAALFADGCAAATPTLRQALSKFTEVEDTPEELPLLWLATMTAPVVWDDARWDVLSRRDVELAQSTGTLRRVRRCRPAASRIVKRSERGSHHPRGRRASRRASAASALRDKRARRRSDRLTTDAVARARR